MAESTLLQIASTCNASDGLITESLHGQPAILSTQIAEKFGKRHKHILRDIEQIKSQVPEIFYRTNFGPSFREAESGNGTVRKFPAYLLTRDAFCLLVMGFTGKAAMLWKIRYIEAFNALEKAALERGSALAREAGFQQGRDEALCLPVMEAERKKGYLEGLKEGKRIARRGDRFAALVKIAAYRQKGLTSSEIGKILDLSADAVRQRVKRAKNLGFWPQGPQTPCQQSLPGVK